MRAIRRARISSPAQRARLPSRKQASTNRTPRRRILPTTASTRPGGARRMIVTESGKSRRWVVKTNQMKYYCTERLAIAECTGVARGSRLWRKLELRRSHFAAVPAFAFSTCSAKFPSSRRSSPRSTTAFSDLRRLRRLSASAPSPSARVYAATAVLLPAGTSPLV